MQADDTGTAAPGATAATAGKSHGHANGKVNGHAGENGRGSRDGAHGGADRGVAPAGTIGDAAIAGGGAAPPDDETRIEGREDRPEITVPGRHTVRGRRRIRRGVDTFADVVLSKLPTDLLYNSAGTVGLLAPDPLGGNVAFDAVAVADMEYVVDQHTQLRTWVNVNREPRSRFVNCTSKLAKVILARARRSPVARLLTRVVQYPSYAPGFTLYPPGWSPDGTFYDRPDALAEIEPETEESVIREVLDDLVVDFPFRGEPDRQNFYGQLLTAILRPALDGNVPLHATIAAMPRTGKSKLIEEVWGGIILGRPTPAQRMSANEEELEKRVVSLLVAGDTLIHLDNMPASIDSPLLASLLTAGEFQARLLGTNRAPRFRNTLILAASANNPRFTEELAKRTVPIRLQPADEHPENRTGFSHKDLRGYVREVRPAVLACLLGMVERWKAAGRPPGRKVMGGFEAWAMTVGGIMEANGFKEWMGNADEWRKQADPETDDLRALITEWARFHHKRALTATQAMDLAVSYGLFTGVFENKKTQASKLSAFSRRVLGIYVDRPIAGLRITVVRSGNNTEYRLDGDDDSFAMTSHVPPRERMAGHAEPGQEDSPDFT